jgi:HAD superfamily hydrolase (TIGR01509 family)
MFSLGEDIIIVSQSHHKIRKEYHNVIAGISTICYNCFMIKALIFDFAGVIGVDAYWIWLEENVPDLAFQRAYFQAIADQVDRAEIPNQEFVRLIAERLGVNSEEIWPQIYEKLVLNKELLAFIRQLKKKYTIALLSNYTYEWLEEVIARENLAPLFDIIFISSRYASIKPEADAFQKVVERLHVAPHEAVFIDDRQINVDGARNLGIQALLFTDLAQLRQDLASLGVVAG